MTQQMVTDPSEGNLPQCEHPAPRLLKARMRHTRLFIAALVMLQLISESRWGEGHPLHEILEWAGHVLVIAGTFGRVYCSLYIGGRKNDEVVCEGPYSIVRNPLYVCSFVAVIGIGLQSTSLLFTAILLMTFVLYYPSVIAREEAFLLHRFDEPYRQYMQRVPRWIPKLSLWHAPLEVPVKPRFVLRTLMDAAVFFLPYPCFELISALHLQGILPVWIYLP